MLVGEGRQSAIHVNLHGGPNLLTCSQCICPLHINTHDGFVPTPGAPNPGASTTTTALETAHIQNLSCYWFVAVASLPSYPIGVKCPTLSLKNKSSVSSPPFGGSFSVSTRGFFFSPTLARAPQNKVRVRRWTVLIPGIFILCHSLANSLLVAHSDVLTREGQEEGWGRPAPRPNAVNGTSRSSELFWNLCLLSCLPTSGTWPVMAAFTERSFCTQNAQLRDLQTWASWEPMCTRF